MKNSKEDKERTCVCFGCFNWEVFGKDCHYYWECKRICTKYLDNYDSQPKYKAVPWAV